MAWQEIIRDSCFRLFFHDSRKKLRWWLMGWCKASTIMNYFIQLKCKKLVDGKDTKTRNLFILRTNFLLLIKRFNYICQQLLQCFSLSSSMRFSGTANPLVCMYLWKHHRAGVTKLGFISLDSLKNRGTKLKSSRRRSHLLFTACLPSGQWKEEWVRWLFSKGMQVIKLYHYEDESCIFTARHLLHFLVRDFCSLHPFSYAINST